MKLYELFIKKKTSQLNEINMSPGALQSWSKKYAAGMNAGFEAELCFAGLLSDDDAQPMGHGEPRNVEQEEDYDADERCRSIDQIIRFFNEGPMNPMRLDNLRDQLDRNFTRWRESKIENEWNNSEYNIIETYIEDNIWDWNRKIRKCLDEREELNATELDIDRAIEVGNQFDHPDYTKRPDINDKSVENAYKLYAYGKRLATNLLETTIENSIANEDRIFNDAYEHFVNYMVRDDFTESQWLDGAYMRDIYNGDWGVGDDETADVDWPYWVDVEEEEDTNLNVRYDGQYYFHKATYLAEQFHKKFGFKTLVIKGTRSEESKRTTSPDTWVFERDGSITTSGREDMPIEIVAPYYPLETTLELMPRFFAWVKSLDGYTNETTGLHMSVSIAEHKGQDLDFVKTVLFLGDDYVLDQFGRAGNDFCESSLAKIKEKSEALDQRVDPDTLKLTHLESELDNLRDGLDRIAANSLAKAKGFGKYYTVNPKSNYIEFRSAGGEDYIDDLPKIQSTMRRYALATSLGMSRDAEKQEYAKKLYKILGNVKLAWDRSDTTFGPPAKLYKKGAMVAVEPVDNNAVWYFSQYVAGLISRWSLSHNILSMQQSRAHQRRIDNIEASHAAQDALFTLDERSDEYMLVSIRNGRTRRVPVDAWGELRGITNERWRIINSSGGVEYEFKLDSINHANNLRAEASMIAREWLIANINSVYGREFKIIPTFTVPGN